MARDSDRRRLLGARAKAGVCLKQAAGCAPTDAGRWPGAAATSMHATWSRSVIGFDDLVRAFGLGKSRGGKDLEPGPGLGAAV